MAEAIALKIISKNKNEFGGIWVTSAGTYAMEGVQASNNAIQVAHEEGINLKDFRSKAINPKLVNEADIILTMNNSHKQQLLNLVPEAEDKIFLLKEFILGLDEKEAQYKKAEMQELEISDPFGQPVDVYRKCYKELYTAISKALEKLVTSD